MIWLMGFIHCYFDYLGLTLMFSCACVCTWNISKSAHNSMGLIEEGLNSGDYQTLSLSVTLSLFLLPYFAVSNALSLISVIVAVTTTGMSTVGVHRGFLRKYGERV